VEKSELGKKKGGGRGGYSPACPKEKSHASRKRKKARRNQKAAQRKGRGFNLEELEKKKKRVLLLKIQKGKERTLQDQHAKKKKKSAGSLPRRRKRIFPIGSAEKKSSRFPEMRDPGPKKGARQREEWNEPPLVPI